MSYYKPDHDATAGDPWNVAFLSDRDVSGQVPINFVPHPGVYLTPACFANNVYEDASFEECFSNLLASNMRRFVFDVYWDSLNRVFRLCPVETPTLQNNSTTSTMHSAPTTTTGQLSSQNITLSSTISTLTNSSTSIATSTYTTAIATTTSASGSTLYQLGPYQCTSTLNLKTVFAVLGNYITDTSTTPKARLQFIVLNLRAASEPQTPTTPRQNLTQSELPSANELVSKYLESSSFNTNTYSPSILQNERKNLNNTWFAQSDPIQYPLMNYLETSTLSNGDLSTQDGWPCENYVQDQLGKRLLVGYGTIDAQMDGYNYQGDGADIFAPGYLTADRSAKLDSSGNVASGCFYSSTLNEVQEVNSSWATSTVINVNESVLGDAADNLTLCGIAPILNYTLGNEPASVDYEPYQMFANQALFSWASGQPMNASTAGETAESVVWACAVMVSNTSYQGHWRVDNCRKKYRVACREANLPYVWTLSDDEVTYEEGMDACNGNSSFDVPRTGLENTYLDQRIHAISNTQDDPSLLDGIWVNFNSIDVADCWVTTGPNGTCPYIPDEDTIRQRQILVPTIAAFIVLLLTALTMLVKLNANRRKSKVRKRGEGGWDYEGVPS